MACGSPFYRTRIFSQLLSGIGIKKCLPLIPIAHNNGSILNRRQKIKGKGKSEELAGKTHPGKTYP
jgi:hypothetical protein